MSRAKKELWVQDAIKKPGSLRKTLRVPKGKKIPEAKLEKAEHSKSPLTRMRANLAETMKHFDHKKKGGSMSVPSKKMSFRGASRAR